MGFRVSAKHWRWVAVALAAALVAAVALRFVSDGRGEEKTAKIGFVILGDINVPGWNASHYNGIKAACDEYGLTLLVRDNVRENSGECPAAIKELAAEGANMIFLASYSYSVEAGAVVSDYPAIAFATSSALTHARNMTAYFARMYQARYLSGALAGLRTKSNVIGYVAAMPNSEVNRGISAFTLGVRRTNPKARVVVTWTGAWQDETKEMANAERLIKEAGADVLTYHQDEDAVGQIAEKNGVDFIGYNALLSGYSEHYLTSVACHWDVYYNDVVERYLKGELNTVKNHWLGIERGAVYLSEFSSAVTPEMRRKIDALQQELLAGRLIFSGEIYDRQGNLRCAEGEAISDDTLLERIDWLVEGVDILE